MRRRTFVGGALAALTTACGATPRTPTIPPAPTVAPPTVAATATPLTVAVSAATVAVPTATATPAARGLLYVRTGFEGGTRGYTIVDTARGATMRDLPPGPPAADWSSLYTVAYDGTRTTVQALDPLTGATQRATMLAGKFDFPTDTLAGTAGGLSPSGKWLVLSGAQAYIADAPNRTRVESSFTVLDTTFAQPPKRVDLGGDYTIDTVADDGNALFLIENVPTDTATPGTSPGVRYRVMVVDLASSARAPQLIVDKTAKSDTMTGTRSTTIATPSGEWLFSLYLNSAQGPFIHALNLSARYAVCIFLPTTAKEDMSKQLLWSLARTPHGNALYAVNGALGIVAEIDPQGLSTRRTVTLPMPVAHAPAPLASLARWLSPVAVSAKGLARGDAALSPDGQTLYALAERGLLVVNTRDLTLRGHFLPDWSLSGVLVSADGGSLYAASGDRGKIVSLDPATGAMRGEVPGVHDPTSIAHAT